MSEGHSDTHMEKLNGFSDFTTVLLDSGFSLGGGNDEGIYAIVNYDWLNHPPGARIRWHTGDPETDPWEWRIRVLNERDDIAYAKCFFKKSGYITQEFYPYFLALRRGGLSLSDEYDEGNVSRHAKRIYEVIEEYGLLPMHEIKARGGFTREEKSKFDAALIDLQMRLYITISGTSRRKNKYGEEYGWNTTMFCTTESFWSHTDVFERAAAIGEDEAYAKIHERVLKLNPAADEKKIQKFAKGK